MLASLKNRTWLGISRDTSLNQDIPRPQYGTRPPAPDRIRQSSGRFRLFFSRCLQIFVVGIYDGDVHRSYHCSLGCTCCVCSSPLTGHSIGLLWFMVTLHSLVFGNLWVHLGCRGKIAPRNVLGMYCKCVRCLQWWGQRFVLSLSEPIGFTLDCGISPFRDFH